jgi:hypothetical protein
MKKILIAILTILSLATPAAATAQFQEIIKINGKEEGMTVLPLNGYLEIPENAARFKPYLEKAGRCTALWRNYLGHWEIKDRKLYLTKFEVDACSQENKKFIPLDKLFPGKPQPVFAEWYSDNIIIPRGKLLEYIHMGYESRYERYLVMSIKKGVVVKEVTITDKEYQRRRRNL